MMRRDPDDPSKGAAIAVAAGVALSIASIGLLSWMALDVDDDGAKSYEELRAGTSPTNGDTDGDGVADGWEIANGYDPLAPMSSPLLRADSVSELGGILAECSIEEELLSLCSSDAEAQGSASTEAEPAEAAAPPSGGNGVQESIFIGGLTTVIAVVSGRLIAGAIMKN